MKRINRKSVSKQEVQEVQKIVRRARLQEDQDFYVHLAITGGGIA